MARTPKIPDADLTRLEAFVQSQGYPAASLQRVPHDVLP